MREGIQLGPFIIHYYGVIIMLGALLAAWIATKQARAAGGEPDMIWDMLPWLLVAGIVGARIWHILTPPASMVAIGLDTKYYFTHPIDAISIWKGGLGHSRSGGWRFVSVSLVLSKEKSRFSKMGRLYCTRIGCCASNWTLGKFHQSGTLWCPDHLFHGKYLLIQPIGLLDMQIRLTIIRSSYTNQFITRKYGYPNLDKPSL